MWQTQDERKLILFTQLFQEWLRVAAATLHLEELEEQKEEEKNTEGEGRQDEEQDDRERRMRMSRCRWRWRSSMLRTFRLGWSR